MKRSPSLFDDLLGDQGDLDPNERHSVGMKLFQAKQEAPEYEGYRLREKLLGHAKSESSGNNTEITSVDQAGNVPGERFTETGPRAGTAYTGGKRFLESAKRLWDRFIA
ncbi:MAG: hypothetical protein EOS32_06155 [Mesorhizobium sp.]|nr:MAG: hypothetical protein EOS32_06155 [Mesorhizobium sp.]